MYTAEEQGIKIEDAQAIVVASEINEKANKETISIDPEQAVAMPVSESQKSNEPIARKF